MEGIVTKSTGSWYTVKGIDGNRYECRLRGRFKIEGVKSTNPLAVGDRVDFAVDKDQSTGIITVIHDRNNHIIRKATNLSRQTHVIAANIDQAVVIATLAHPRTSTGFIDRFLVTCEAYSIKPLVFFNKADILHEEGLGYARELMQLYEGIGYETMMVSAVSGQNLDRFKAVLANKTTLLSGHSGVGKSTLINAIDGNLNLKTQSISYTHLKGKHTTTFAEMFELSNGGFIIDTPGIKEFGLANFEAWELCHYFPEMQALFNQCRYDNCTHHNEPGCKVKEELEGGNISQSRYTNYLSMLLGEER